MDFEIREELQFIGKQLQTIASILTAVYAPNIEAYNNIIKKNQVLNQMQRELSQYRNKENGHNEQLPIN